MSDTDRTNGAGASGSAQSDEPGRARAARRVVAELERMIVTGELLPGQAIRQELMAERLGVSRLPIREGLRQLTAQGLVAHQHNAGYTVARLDQTEFDQIYLMRGVLEREVLSRLPLFGPADLAEVRRLGEQVVSAAERGDILEMRLRNQDFHFAMFERSRLHLVVSELRRLWTLAMPYHAAYLYDPDGRRRVCAEHDSMIEALAAGDNAHLVELMDEHRHGGEANTGMILGVRHENR
ncbi:GntR family transcriptional regulator [Gordonia terrae]|uniref:GntR family transcriptional regulator n=2 Tax=Gordonia terrae TaxID=2055 RepID=A0AAD0NYI1_9ACTN|nr:GntR family transcriptional regulator [Gordonia terrae]VTR09643.1 transcriptional regulator, GntR family [Clostridioides difficile]ANY22250.1 GntR family transcriptional regulator [Gordonia terrae]AWO82989.1 GntR family transcriptional regulator [Gordonia terrae]VTS30568.1 HTH-type transcriptional regulator mcbR [Gordonia terrae]GAB46277.1 putative GntR family transcriptional regulator [Gordonia terrae NBRC 100016]